MPLLYHGSSKTTATGACTASRLSSTSCGAWRAILGLPEVISKGATRLLAGLQIQMHINTESNRTNPSQGRQRPEDALVLHRQGKGGGRHAGLGHQHTEEEILAPLLMACREGATLADLNFVHLRGLPVIVGFISVAAGMVGMPGG